MINQMTLEHLCTACGGTYYGPKEYYHTCVEGITIDSRTAGAGWLFAATVGERVDGHSFIKGCYEKGVLCCLGEQPPVSEEHPYIQVSSTFQALKEIAAYYRQLLTIPFIGITGSVGKTSTKEMIASVLSVSFSTLKTSGNFNNEVGVPLTMFRIRPEHEAAVLEMGISDFGEMHRLSAIVRPNICVMTNIGFCHLERLGDRDGVLKAKSEIFDFASEGFQVVLNGDDDKLHTLKDRKDLKVTSFGLEPSNDIFAKNVKNLGLDGMLCDIVLPEKTISVHIPIPGIHMVYNALAGACVGLLLGMSPEKIQEGIEKSETISGRNHIIHTKNYVIMDDCYNANPVSMKASLDVLSNAPGRKVAILGDMGELGTEETQLHFDVGEYAAKKQIDLLLCVGSLSEKMIKGAAAINPDMNAHLFQTKEDLLEKLPELLNKGDSILIKASHFMQFEKIVKALED